MRRDGDIMLAALPARFLQLEGRVNRIDDDLQENTTLTRAVNTKTARIVSFVDDVEVVWKFCKVFRRWTFVLAKWSLAVTAAVTGFIGMMHAIGTVDVRTWFR